MQPFALFPPGLGEQIRFVLTDVDDTLTDGPRLPAAAYQAVERLGRAGMAVIPVTAAPAGWCDLICRMWPVAGVIGENGGLYFSCNPAADRTSRHYWTAADQRAEEATRLAELANAIPAALSGVEIAHDQRYRETTLAFRNPGPELARRVVGRLHAAGAQATLNTLWVLGWLGGFDKLLMTRRVLAEHFAADIDCDPECCLYVGDSLNDAPMFGFFPHSVGVSTVRQYADRLPALPRWITAGAGGAGFVEVADALLAGRG